jgi:hypothetical protein
MVLVNHHLTTAALSWDLESKVRGKLCSAGNYIRQTGHHLFAECGILATGWDKGVVAQIMWLVRRRDFGLKKWTRGRQWHFLVAMGRPWRLDG